MDVDRVLHGVGRAAVVAQANLHHVAAGEAPVDGVVLQAGVQVAQDPPHLAGGGDPVHARHGAAPLHGVEERAVQVQQRFERVRQVAERQRQQEPVVDGPVELVAIAVDVGAGVRVAPQLAEAGRVVRRGRSVGHGDRAEHRVVGEVVAVDVIDRPHAVGQRRFARPVEEDLDDVAFGRGDDHAVDQGLPLELPEVGRHQLDRSAAERQVERAGVRDVDQEEADDLAAGDGQAVVRLAVDEQQVPEAAHQRVGGPLAAERRESRLVEEQVVEHQHLLAVGRTEVARVGRLHLQRAVQPQILLDVLAVVRVVPVDAGVREVDAVAERPARFDRRLRQPGNAVEAVLEADAVPVDGGRQVEPVGDVDGDRGLLRHLDEGAGILPVEAVHGERAAGDGAPDESGLQMERAAVAEPHHLARPRRRRRLRRGRQERVDGRGEAAEARHRRHRRMHRRARPPAGGGRRRGVPDHPGQRQQILRLHPHPGRRAPQHDAAPPRRRRRVRLGGDEHQELVEVDRPERRAAVGDRSQVPDGAQPRGGRPGDVAAVAAERGRVRQPVDAQGEVEPVVAVDGDGGAERRR